MTRESATKYALVSALLAALSTLSACGSRADSSGLASADAESLRPRDPVCKVSGSLPVEGEVFDAQLHMKGADLEVTRKAEDLEAKTVKLYDFEISLQFIAPTMDRPNLLIVDRANNTSTTQPVYFREIRRDTHISSVFDYKVKSAPTFGSVWNRSVTVSCSRR